MVNKPGTSFNFQDLKDLDVDQLLELMGEYKNTVIKFVLIVVSLIIALMIFGGFQVKQRILQSQMAQIQQKIGAIKDRDNALKVLNDFKSSMPGNFTEMQLITTIADTARAQHITISSLSPAENMDMGLYDLVDVSVVVRTDDFRKMMFFLRRIETSQLPLRIDKLSGEASDGQLTFTIKVSAVLIHP